jgi:hypothetical protein
MADEKLSASLRLALGTVGRVAGREGGAPERDARCEALIERIDDALRRHDVHAVLRAWNTAALAARESRHWAGYVALGDAALRIGFTTGFRTAFGAEARNAYLAALGRANLQRSLDGVLRVAHGFAALGEEDLVEQCLLIAERLEAAGERRGRPRS